ncbi:MAG TPA: GAF domain-containing protein, partial [Acidimicrobiia bacterium]|nr:GAF domain-containing protein [Acidimicrobiia bacterium]
MAVALNRAMTVDDVTTAIFEHVAPAARASTVGLWLVDEPAGAIRLVGSAGYQPGADEWIGTIALGAAIPAAEVVTSRTPVTYRSRSERDRRWPTLAELPSSSPAAVVFPLLARERVFGVLALGFTSGDDFTEETVALLAAVSEQCALALDRARLFDAEHRARETLEFLAGATRLLVSVLDPREVLERLVAAAVPRLADSCAVHVERGGRLHRVAMRIDGIADAASLLVAQPVDTQTEHPLARAFTTAELQVLEILRDEDIETVEPGRARDARDFGIRGALAVPLIARGQPRGVVSFAFRDSKRLVDPDVRYAVNGLAARAAVALDNAQRYDDERVALRTLAETLLPSGLPRIPGFEVAARYVAASGAVGGDWFDVHTLDDDAFLVGVGDVAGHAMEATARMSELRHTARTMARWHRRPRALLGELARFAADADRPLLTTVAYARFRTATGRGRWASAGHPPAIHVRGGTPVVLGAPHGPPLGVKPAVEYR